MRGGHSPPSPETVHYPEHHAGGVVGGGGRLSAGAGKKMLI